MATRNRYSVTWRRRALILVGSFAGLGLMAFAHSGPEPAPAASDNALLNTSDWERFSVEIETRVRTVDAQGRPERVARPMRHRWERIKSGTNWRTVMTRLTPRTVTVTVPGKPDVEENIPQGVSRIEDDGDGSKPRMYDDAGNLIAPPTMKTDPGIHSRALKAGAPDWSALQQKPRPQAPPVAGDRGALSMVILDSQKAARRQALERDFGTSVGRVETFDRFLGRAKNDLTEVLVDPVLNVLVQVNRVSEGQLVSHMRFKYAPGPAGIIYRTDVSVEEPLSSRTGGRRIMETSYSKFVINGVGGGR